jgi:hypothetical protein
LSNFIFWKQEIYWIGQVYKDHVQENQHNPKNEGPPDGKILEFFHFFLFVDPLSVMKKRLLPQGKTQMRGKTDKGAFSPVHLKIKSAIVIHLMIIEAP